MMGFTRLFVLLLVASVVTSVRCHHHRAFHENDRLDHARRLRDEDVNAVLSSDVGEKNRRSLNIDEQTKGSVPFSPKRLEKMLEKAILKIITGDLSTANMLLLKSLNYSLEEVLAIRERELNRRKDEEYKEDTLKSWTKALFAEDASKDKPRHWTKSPIDHFPSSPKFEGAKRDGKDRRSGKSREKELDFEAYNRQAVLDYENLPTNLEVQQSWSDPASVDYEDSAKDLKGKESSENFHRNFDRAMEPHVVFKIRYDDSEFDSNSNSAESAKDHSKHRLPPILRHTTSRNAGNSFHASSATSSPSSAPLPAAVRTPLPLVHRAGNAKVSQSKTHPYASTTALPATAAPATSTEVGTDAKGPTKKHEPDAIRKKVSEYEGLEWVEDDVYRVIPAFVDSLGYENNEENETSDYDESGNDYRQNWNGFPEQNENDTLEYQNDTPDSVKLVEANTNVTANNSLSNLSTYQQLAIAHRREGNLTASFDSQGQKAIEDIKSRVLVLTGRFNHSANANQIQRERLTMFSPTCQIPRNTDPDAWTDQFSMNMHFQLNLTAGDHVVAAKLRIFKLPQQNLTSSAPATFEEEEEDEKKIRISIYYYTKSLKKHRSKKRLMDSVVTPLTPDGTHLALDVRQGLRFWRLNPRNPHGNGSNHGLVIQVEDQDGRPLKPALYIQQPSCADHDSDQKAYQRVPALFIRACTRYVRIVNGETVTYVNCRH